MPTWDEPKRLRNIKNHGLDFIDCEDVFSGPVFASEDAREADGEQRINLLGWLGGIVVHMTYTERGDEPHIISLRKAEKHESVATPKKLPVTPAEWEALIAAAPGKDGALSAAEQKKMANGVVVNGDGYATVRAARQGGTRGLQVAPTKQLVTVRYSPEVLQYFKATGAGWQTRMNDALLEWVSKRSARRRSRA